MLGYLFGGAYKTVAYKTKKVGYNKTICFEGKLDQKKWKYISCLAAQTKQMLDLLKIESLEDLYVIFYFVKISFKFDQADIQNDWEVLLISQKIPNSY